MDHRWTSTAGARLYTRRQLVLEARARGRHVTESLIDDWVGLGLLDQAQRRSRGRGRGVAAGWSRRQRDLLLDLLARRQQLRRALETYSAIGRRRPRTNDRPIAARLIRRIARPAARRQAIGDSGRSGQLDAEALAPLLQEVVGPPAPTARAC